MKHFSVLIFIMILSSCQDSEQVQIVDFVTPVEAAIVVKSDVIRYHQIPTVLLAKNRAELAFQLSGTVDEVFVNIGQKVEIDQPLMSIYNPNLDPAIESNLAKLESLKVQINQVKRDVNKLQELRKNNSTSKSALEQKETDLQDLQAQQKLVQSQVNLSLANQSESVIKAPFNGTVISSFKQQGEFAQAGQVVMTIFQQDVLEVEINITQILWKNLKLGNQVTGQYLNETVTFEVVELSQTADPKSHLMKVILQLNETIDNSIGQQVVINLPQKYNSIYQLPLETIVDDGINRPYIFSVVNEQAFRNYIDPLYIENGQIVFNTFEEVQGTVIFKGQSKLSDGMKVKVL